MQKCPTFLIVSFEARVAYTECVLYSPLVVQITDLLICSPLTTMSVKFPLMIVASHQDRINPFHLSTNCLHQLFISLRWGSVLSLNMCIQNNSLQTAGPQTFFMYTSYLAPKFIHCCACLVKHSSLLTNFTSDVLCWYTTLMSCKNSKQNTFCRWFPLMPFQHESLSYKKFPNKNFQINGIVDNHYHNMQFVTSHIICPLFNCSWF